MLLYSWIFPCISILRERKPRPLRGVKVKEGISSFFQKVLVNLRSDFFLIFLFPLLDMGLGNIFTSGTCPRNLTLAGQNGHWNLKIARVSFIGRIHLRSRGIWKIALCLLFWDRKNIDFQPGAGRRSKKPLFAYMTQYKAIWYLFHPNLRSNCKFCVAYHVRNNKTSRIFQEQAEKFKRTSLQSRSPFEIAYCKGKARFSLDENSFSKRDFRTSSS